MFSSRERAKGQSIRRGLAVVGSTTALDPGNQRKRPVRVDGQRWSLCPYASGCFHSQGNEKDIFCWAKGELRRRRMK